MIQNKRAPAFFSTRASAIEIWSRVRKLAAEPLGKAALSGAAALATLLLLFAGTILAVQAAYDGRMLPGVYGLGVGIGGQTPVEARATLDQRVAEMVNRSITIGHQELRWTIQGHHLGIRPNVERVLDEAYNLGRQGNLFARGMLMFGLVANGRAQQVDSPLHDPIAMAQFMDALAVAVNRPVADARLVIRPDGSTEFADGASGRGLNVDLTRDRLERAFESPGLSHVELAVEENQPAVTTADLAIARERATALLSTPLVLTADGAEWRLSVEQLAQMAEVTPARDVRLNRDAVRTWASRFAREVDQTPQDARFTWSNGTVSLLRPSKDGRQLDVDRTADLVVERAFDPERSLEIPIAISRPDVSQDDGPNLGIKGLIEVARTSFGGASPPKQHNIALATQRLNGVVIPPGKLFSFNREVGPTTLDNGYKLGWGIANTGANVRTVPAAAGGICQVATTLFHSVFWAGYQIEERNHHLYWIPSYATRGIAGLDATVDEDFELDFRFWNNTDSHLLIQSWTEGASVVFGLYGAKPNWTVKVTPGERSDVVEANRDQVNEEEPTLPLGQRLAVEGAQDGFKITTARTVTHGTDVRTLRITSLYKPSRNVVLTGTGGRPARPQQVATNQATRAAVPPRTSTTTATPAPTAPTPTPKPGVDSARQNGPTNPTRAPAATPAPRRS